MRFAENILCDSNGNTIIKTYHVRVAPRKRGYREHHHTECELSVVIAGRGIYSVYGREYNFYPGDMFLFGSDETHCITDIYDEIHFLNIQFEPRILWENPENIELLSIFNSRNKNFSNKFSSADTTLKNIITGIEKEMSDKNTGYVIVSRYMLLSALVHIMRKYNYTNSDKSLNSISTTSKSLKKAITYINSNLENKITLKEIADIACMTETYFSSVFKKLNGISPWEYITIKRVEMAIEMLKTTDMTKLEIAGKCGFNSSSNFYKAFFKITGKTPKDYSGN